MNETASRCRERSQRGQICYYADPSGRGVLLAGQRRNKSVQAIVASFYVKKVKLCLEAKDRRAEIKLRAERKAGQLSKGDNPELDWESQRTKLDLQPVTNWYLIYRMSQNWINIRVYALFARFGEESSNIVQEIA